MADRTVNINAVKFGYVRSDNPGTHYPTNANSWYDINWPTSLTGQRMYVQFANVASSIRRNKLLGISFTIQAQGSVAAIGAYRLAENTAHDFSADTITWRNMPDVEASSVYDSIASVTGVGSAGNYALQGGSSGLSAGKWFFERGRIACFREYWGGTASMKTVLANGSSAPYATITYDDSEVIDPDCYGITAGDPVNPRASYLYFKFGQPAGNYFCADVTWTVSALKIYVKQAGESSYRELTISPADLVQYGSDMDLYQLKLPDGTLTPGLQLQWYAKITDQYSAVYETEPVTQSVDGLTVDFGTVPSGTVSSANVLSFEWTLKNSRTETDYPQDSATIWWKTESDANYSAIFINSSSKSYSAPAYTFPPGKTITFYISATANGSTAITHDAGGNIRTRNFTTRSASITLQNYPSGNNVCSGDLIYFKWNITDGLKDLAQTSAKLYWRYDTQQNYSQLSISGSTKEYSVPANTFDTDKKVLWYLVCTLQGGTTVQSAEKSFNTAESQITQQGGPTSGYKDPREAITFACYFAAGSGSVTGTGKLYWKVSTAGSYTEVAMTNNQVTIAANTFPVASTIQWYMAGTDYSGNSSQTEVYSFSTAASTVYPTCVSPVGRVEDGSKPITFRWTVQNDDGTPQSQTVMQWKEATASSWTTLLNVLSAAYSYTAAADTFPAGPIDWRVAVKNRDSVQGPIAYASFICMRAPDAPAGLSATPVPRTTVSWQSGEQEAYEISIDGIVVAKEYGPGVYSWQPEEPLADGVHSITVRVQGAYGLWSNPSTTTIDVENVPATTITLDGVFGVDAHLMWSYGASVSDPEPNVYRDGVRIAALSDKLEFLDRFVLGEHEYYVTLWDSDGNYSISNIVTGTMESEVPRICAADGGEWLELRLTDASDEVEDFQWSRNYALHTVRGASYPVLETGIHESLTASYSCAFRTAAEARQLEALRGKIVIMKTRKENVAIGGLLSLKKQVRQFYVSCAFSLQQVHWEDFIRDENR